MYRVKDVIVHVQFPHPLPCSRQSNHRSGFLLRRWPVVGRKSFPFRGNRTQSADHGSNCVASIPGLHAVLTWCWSYLAQKKHSTESPVAFPDLHAEFHRQNCDPCYPVSQFTVKTNQRRTTQTTVSRVACNPESAFKGPAGDQVRGRFTADGAIPSRGRTFRRSESTAPCLR